MPTGDTGLPRVTRLPWWLRRQSVCLQGGRPRFDPWVGKISWSRKWQPTPVLLPGTFYGRRSLVGYSPWGRKELDTTERLQCQCMSGSQTHPRKAGHKRSLLSQCLSSFCTVRIPRRPCENTNGWTSPQSQIQLV